MYKGSEVYLESEQYLLDSNIHNFFLLLFRKKYLKLYLKFDVLH